MTTSATRPRIVVGVDGSQGSQDALRWAAHHAELVGADLDVLIAWSLPEIYAYTSRDYAADARDTLTRAVQQALGPDTGEHVRLHVVEGHPAAALTTLCADAELLVVGKKGHGGFAGMSLGSVSQHCVAHACCPTVVVPSTTPQ